MDKHNISALISKNLAGEAGAIQGYEELLSLGVLEEVDVITINEIISDEKNHELKLQAMQKKYDGVSASPDGTSESLSEIKDGVENG